MAALHKQLRRTLFAEDSTCPLCKRQMVLKKHGRRPPNNLATIDHIVPQSAYGSDDADNLRLICARCNEAKANLLPGEASTPAGRQALALEDAATQDIAIDPFHVTVACSMCEAMGMDPNTDVGDGDDLKAWHYLLPGAAAACHLLQRQAVPKGDLLAVPSPDGTGFLMRITEDGQLWLREGLEPMTPLFTLVNRDGDVTLAVGPPDLKATASERESGQC